MEVGKSKDIWFRSCTDLVISRFFPVDFVPYSITEMHVLIVTRIHNQFLQDRFERTLESHVSESLSFRLSVCMQAYPLLYCLKHSIAAVIFTCWSDFTYIVERKFHTPNLWR